MTEEMRMIMQTKRKSKIKSPVAHVANVDEVADDMNHTILTVNQRKTRGQTTKPQQERRM